MEFHGLSSSKNDLFTAGTGDWEEVDASATALWASFFSDIDAIFEGSTSAAEPLVNAVSGKKRIIQIALTPARIVVIYFMSYDIETINPKVPSPTQVFGDKARQNKAERTASSKKQYENTHLPAPFMEEKQILDNNCGKGLC